MIRAVLFDLDGTLADTERLHWRAYRQVLLELGVDVGLEEYRRHFILVGGGPEYACRTYALPITPDELRARKAILYRTLIRGGVQACPGVRATLERLRATHQLAVATNSMREETAVILGQLGVEPLFEVVVSREDYERQKPAPDAYLAAAARLGLAPAACVVVEDTPRGLKAGRAAGMPVVAVPSDLTGDGDFAGATRRLARFEDLTAELLAGLDTGG